MAESRGRHEWDQTSIIWATIMNAHRDAKKHSTPFSWLDIHPYRNQYDVKPEPVEADISVLKLLLNNA